MTEFRSSITVSYSHAAPFIRRDLARAAGEVQKRQRAGNARAKFDGLRDALEILVAADDYQAEPGIAERDKLSADELDALRAVLGDDYERLIGEPFAGKPELRAVVERTADE